MAGNYEPQRHWTNMPRETEGEREREKDRSSEYFKLIKQGHA